MMWDVARIIGYKVVASDGDVGTVKDILFDDASWTMRWLVVGTGNWFFDRQVLLPVSTLGVPDSDLKHFPVRLTRQQVKDSPDVDTQLPVSRQLEAQIYAHYSWDPYWQGSFYPMGNAMAMPFVADIPAIVVPDADASITDAPAHCDDPHLRNVNALMGFSLDATDGAIGHVEDMLVDSVSWRIRYLKIDAITWMPGDAVLISPQSISAIDWPERTVKINVSVQRVQDGPKYNDDLARDATYDQKFLTYYGIKWVETPPAPEIHG
jgi:uncharacterized protein YrrD